MNTTALATIQGDELEVIQRTAKLLAASGYFGTSNDGVVGMAQVAAKILAGRELGFGPFAAVNGIHIIQGKPTVGANLMAAAVRSHPRYDYRVKELSDKACELEFFDNGKSAGVSRFTAEDAQTAELSTGRNSATWKKFPRNMLFARAMSNGVRFYAPDIFSGNAVYVPEEMDVAVDGDGNVVDATFTVSHQDAPQPTQRATTPDAPTTQPDAAQRAPVGHSGDVEFTRQAEPVEELPKLSEAQHKNLHAVGRTLYGDEWNEQRPKLVQAISKGAISSSNDLTPEEADKLIAGITKKINEVEQAKMKEAA